MLPSIGFPELLLITLLALIVVGPKDLPKMMGKLSGFLRQVRSMGEEFKGAFNDMAKETELDELRKEINELKNHGKFDGLTADLRGEMRALDTDIRDDVRSSGAAHPRVKSGGEDGEA